MSQIKRKFIQDNAVNGAKFRLDNNQAARARNAANSADIDLFKLDGSDIFTILRQLSLSGFKIVNIADPTSPQDVASKAYVDAVVQGITDVKLSCRVATTAALPSVTYANGTGGVGATLTATANGALAAIDGISLSVGQRLLVKDQAAQLQNGIYIVTQLGDGSNPFILTRATDADSEINAGMFTFVEEGTVNGDAGFLLVTDDPITVGTTALQFTQFTGAGQINPGNGIAKSGNTLSAKIDAGLSFDGGGNIDVQVHNDLVDGSTKIDGSNRVVAAKGYKEVIVLGAGDITNQYVDLAKVACRDTIILQPDGGPKQNEALDFTVNYTGGAGGKSRLLFAGDLGTGGSAALSAGDTLYIAYQSLDY